MNIIALNPVALRLQNTHVVELYSRLEKNEKQLTYYNSGIGTYVQQSWSLPRLWQVIDHGIDMAIAWSDGLLRVFSYFH